MSRPVVGLAAVVGVSALAFGGLALAGSEPAPTVAGGWTGWTGHIDPSSTSDLAAMTPDDAVAVTLLARAARAATRLAYSGRAASTGAGAKVEAEVVHVPGRGTVVTAVTPAPDAPTLHPDGRSGTLADDGAVLDLLRIHFRVLREADLDAVVAGRPADAVIAVGAEGVLAARFWLDHATGLLLRKQLLGADGRVRRTSTFETLRLGIPTSTSLPPTTSDAWGTVLDVAALAKERAAGCPCPEALPGGLTLVEARKAPAGAVMTSPVVHQVFSDGLETVSLFSLSGVLDRADAEDLRTRGFGARTEGAGTAWVRASASTWTAVWAAGGQVLTLVVSDSEDPTGTARAVLQALPPAPDTDVSLWGRLARGWNRVTGGGS